MMRIAAVEYFRLRPRSVKTGWVGNENLWPPSLPCFLVKVTDEDGTVGIGEASSHAWYLGETPEQLDSCLALYAKELVGRSVGLPSATTLMRSLYGGAAPGSRAAQAGVEMALFDLLGQRLGVPVYDLLGGSRRTTFDLLGNLYEKTPDSMAKASAKLERDGYRAAKVKVGDLLLDEGWSRPAFVHELEILDAALSSVTPSFGIDADANQSWQSSSITIRALARFAGAGNLAIEQPLRAEDLAGHALIRVAGAGPVVLDESVTSPAEVINIVRAGAADRVVVKINRLGGLAAARDAAAIAEAAGLGVSVDTNPFTLVGDTASCHLAATLAVAHPVDCDGHVSFLAFDEPLFSGGVTLSGGRAQLPDAPGLGIEVDWTAVVRHVRA